MFCAPAATSRGRRDRAIRFPNSIVEWAGVPIKHRERNKTTKNKISAPPTPHKWIRRRTAGNPTPVLRLERQRARPLARPPVAINYASLKEIDDPDSPSHLNLTWLGPALQPLATRHPTETESVHLFFFLLFFPTRIDGWGGESRNRFPLASAISGSVSFCFPVQFWRLPFDRLIGLETRPTFADEPDRSAPNHQPVRLCATLFRGLVRPRRIPFRVGGALSRARTASIDFSTP